MNDKLPSEFKRFFWDVNLVDINPEINSRFVIKRVLEWGDLSALKWLFNRYQSTKIKEVVMTSRDIGKNTIDSWKKILHAY